MRNNFGVLFTCIGRRVSLLNCFRRAARQLKINASFLGTDTTELSSALQLCDKGIVVNPITHVGYIKQLLSIVKANNVKLLVPTVDLYLKLLAKNKPKFAAMGCCVLVSTPEVVDICQDKRKTYRFLLKNGFDTPFTKGFIDEVRILNSSRLPEWIETEYNNQIDPKRFYSLSEMEIFDETPPIIVDFGVDDPGDGSPQFWANVTDFLP